MTDSIFLRNIVDLSFRELRRGSRGRGLPNGWMPSRNVIVFGKQDLKINIMRRYGLNRFTANVQIYGRYLNDVILPGDISNDLDCDVFGSASNPSRTSYPLICIFNF